MKTFSILLPCVLLLHVTKSQIYLLCDEDEFTTEDSCSCYNPHQPIITCPSAGLTAIPNITKAHTLQLNNNSLTSLRGGKLSHLTGLTKLEITDNRISDVSVLAFNGVELTLESLDLSSNRLGVVPAAFGMDNDSLNLQGSQVLTKLNVLKLSNNYIYAIENDAFKGVPGLGRLYLDGNPINHIAPNAWMGPPGLHFLGLTVSNMDITRIPTDNLQHLIVLDVRGAKPMRLERFSDWFNAFPLLQHLKLEDMGLEDDHLVKGSFPALLTNQLQSLSLRHNKLTKPPDRLLNKLGLRILDLSGNMMRRVRYFSNQANSLGNLYKLNMSNNLITWINARYLLALHRAQVVDLRHNDLNSMYWGVSDVDENLPQTTLLLGGNRWICNCQRKWLKQLVHRQLDTRNGHLSRDDINSDLRCGPESNVHSGVLVKDVRPSAFCIRD